MEDFREKTGRILDCGVPSILKTMLENLPVENLHWSICLSSEKSFPKIEDLYFESLGVFMNKHQMLQGSFIDVFRGYS